MNFKRILNWLIVVATIALVFAPVISSQLKREVARWHLAAAANAIDVYDGNPDVYVDRARKWVDDVGSLRDYWIVRTLQALDANSSLPVSEVIKEAVAKDELNYSIRWVAMGRLVGKGDFSEVIRILETGRTETLLSIPYDLNSLAYFRSLEITDLDQALEDINEALKQQPDTPAFHDTKAWVLFQMGRNSKALEHADMALDIIEKRESQSWGYQISQFFETLFDDGPDDDEVLTQENTDGYLWSKGVMRYHRARILEALGRTDRAERDWDWLREHNLPLDDRLY